MKIDLIADTNILIYIHEGNVAVKPFLNYNFAISFISEVELLGFKGIAKAEELKLKKLIDDCFLIEWNNNIKDCTIELRKKYSLKLPDSIIASSLIIYNVPLVTADKAFSVIEELDLVLVEI